MLTGTLPQLSQQNLFLGLPLLLMPEEVVLLVENELAVLVDDPKAHYEPSQSSLERWKSKEDEYIQRQITIGQPKHSSLDRSMSEEAIQKRKERQLRRAAEQKSEKPVESAPSVTYNVLIPTTSTSFDWYSTDTASYNSIESAKAAGIWDFPSTGQDRARCGVYRDLWEQGYFIGHGIKFGAEYLVYPGDPLRYHSHFAASVIEDLELPITPMEIVAHGRLGTATKKTHLLCGWDDRKKQVSYFSIEWAGFG